MDPSALSVARQDNGLLVTGDAFEGPGAQEWKARSVDGSRVLLVSREGSSGMIDAPAGFATMGIKEFKDFLIGLTHTGYSGMVAVDTGYGAKKVYLSHGSIVFAASSIIDDRLGEVIYREARISLDELTNSAAQVTKARKFGQVLLASGIFTNVDLWHALKLQVKQILRSLFMSERLYFEMTSENAVAPTEVIFEEDMGELLSECYSYGCAYRAFLGRLTAESTVDLVIPAEEVERQYGPGTFIGDLVSLVASHTNVQDLLGASKLIDNYTVAALRNLVNSGICRIQPEMSADFRAVAHVSGLRSRLDAYSYVLTQVRQSFQEAGKPFPVQDLTRFAAGLNPEGFPSLFVDGDGVIGRNCVQGIFSQCEANPGRVGYFTARIESLIQFLLQITGDNLEFKTAKKIRTEYHAITA